MLLAVAAVITGVGLIAYAALVAYVHRPVRVRRDAPDEGPWVNPHERWPRTGGTL